ncbi:hypothetical protein CFC21_108346 [Triticum aestivum]|uniref:Uncharacterized protein n=2 Tax=Triticum aestivum TaxID=4565 RepID=A0A3B6TMN1_WHEAT|nr:ankyrin repeat domain-containing protein EMB506, chloroplastic-like [Triticum aestivum]KAF7107761.1 hypothetical protein CFC21_108346 [Triticum aestivum]
MLPWAATASSSSAAAAAAAALLHASPLPASHRAALPRYRPSPSLPPPLSVAFRSPARALPRGGDAFWEEPDDGSGGDYEDDGKQATGQRSSPFPPPFPLSRLVATRQQERQEQDLRREIELLLTPEEEAILDQNETADVTKISSPKWHPLHTYALALQIPLMDKLLDNGVDIDLVDKDGFTPLHKVIIGKKEAVISHLLRKGANPHVTDRDGATPLHYAVQVGALQTVKLLIKYRVDVNVADVDGWTPLHLAVQSRNRDITKILLVNGADQTRRTNGGKTPLDLSLCFGRDFNSYDLAKLLKLVPANRGV